MTTAFTFTGSPAAAAASIPSSTLDTGKSTSFISRKVSSSSESRLTVTRSGPAAASACAFAASSEAFVVSVSSAPSGASMRDQPVDVLAHERLAAGEPQFLHSERDGGARDRSISSNVSSSLRSRKR